MDEEIGCETAMYSDGRLATNRLLRLLLLLSSVIAVGMMTSWNADTHAEHGVGPGDSRSYPPLAVNADAGAVAVYETIAMPAPSAIDFHDGKLSVSLDGMPLHQVIAELSRQTGIEIRFIDEHPAASVRMQFSDFALEKGLHLLLSDANAIFVYADTDGDKYNFRQLTKIFLLPKGVMGNSNNETIEIIDVASGISMQMSSEFESVDQQAQKMRDWITMKIQSSIPKTYKEVSTDSAITDIITRQTLGELTENIRKRITSVPTLPN